MSLPQPIRPLRCDNPDCGFPQGLRCARAATIEDPETNCPDLIRSSNEGSEPEVEEHFESHGPPEDLGDDVEPAPWSGRHLTLADARTLMGSSPCRVIAVVGPYDSGKTCLLTSLFLQMANGGTKEALPYVFAGSSSLLGFRTLAKQASRYQGQPGEQVVDHTTFDNPDDAGAFLHLALRPRETVDDRVVQVLLTDVPGEWFDAYADKEDEKNARRLPFLSRCDGFMVLADSSALLADDGAKVDHRTGLVLRRLGKKMAEWKRAAPVVLMLSKYDRIWETIGDPPAAEVALDNSKWGNLGRRLRRTFTALRDMETQGVHVRVVATSAVPRPLDQGQPVGVIEPFAWMLAQIDRRRHHTRVCLPIAESSRPFMAMRREHMP